MNHKILISIGAFLLLVLGIGGTIAAQRGFFSQADADHPTQFIQHDFVDLTKIGAISKFRSGEGHDFSGGGETCRSMKHYFTPAYTAADLQLLNSQPLTQGRHLPPAPTPDTAVAVYAPVDGQITDMQSEHFPVGQQVFITPDKAKGYVIRIFHVYPVDGIKKGRHVTAGEHIGDIGRISATDISIQAGQLNGKYISYFDVMPDSVFAAYQALGIQHRSDLIFTKEFRDSHPFQCHGEEFAQNYSGDDQKVLINGWTNPQAQYPQGQTNTNGNTNTGGNTSSSPANHDVKIILFNDTTSAMIANTAVTVYADTGIRCIQAPCPTGGRTFTGITDPNGSFILPASYVDQQMSALVEGYESGQIPYDQASRGGEITLRLKPKS